MAKLYKEALISTETVFLNQARIEETSAPNALPMTVNEEQLEFCKKEAYEQGYLAGKEELLQQHEQQHQQLKKQLEEMLVAIPQTIAQQRMQLSDEIADIVLLIIQQFFVERQQEPVALAQQINQILGQLNNKQSIELFLHPQEVAALHQGRIQLEATHLNGLKIKADESLRLGGCRLKTEHGVFDASIEKQIDRLKEVLIQFRRQHASTT